MCILVESPSVEFFSDCCHQMFIQEFVDRLLVCEMDCVLGLEMDSHTVAVVHHMDHKKFVTSVHTILI